MLCHQPCLSAKVSAVPVYGKKSKDLGLGLDFQGGMGRSEIYFLPRRMVVMEETAVGRGGREKVSKGTVCSI